MRGVAGRDRGDGLTGGLQRDDLSCLLVGDLDAGVNPVRAAEAHAVRLQVFR